jgi:hypothetical protein
MDATSPTIIPVRAGAAGPLRTAADGLQWVKKWFLVPSLRPAVMVCGLPFPNAKTKGFRLFLLEIPIRTPRHETAQPHRSKRLESG